MNTMLTIFLLSIFNAYLILPTSQELLFKPRNGVKFSARAEVPLLNVNYSIYQTALKRLVDDWLKGKIGTGQPTEQWEIGYITIVNGKVNGEVKFGQKEAMDTDAVGEYYPDESLDKNTRDVYNEMIRIKVPGHLKVVTSHRRWVRLTFKFLQLIRVVFSKEMADLVRRHDLSKYTHREVLGYAIMFGDGALGYRHLENRYEQFEWTNTLHNHYAANPHHPEYFYPLLEDGTRNKTVPVLKLDIENGKYFLQESLIDMLAARGERDLAEDKEFNVKKWFDINERYFRRYGDEDKRYVWQRLMNFTEMASGFFTSSENDKLVQGLFDNRRVVFGNSVYLHLLSNFVLLTCITYHAIF